MATTVLLSNFNSVAPNWIVNGGGTGAPTILAGRTGFSARFAFNNWVDYWIPAVSESDTITVGFAWRADGYATNGYILGLASDAGATFHLTVQIVSAAGAMTIKRGTTSGTVLATTATGVLTVGGASPWYYIEVQAKVHDTTGFVTMRVNGTQVATFSGDTKNAGTKTTFDRVTLLSHVANQWYDDVYVVTGSDGTFLGNQTVPDGASTDVVARHAVQVAVKKDLWHVARHATQVAVKRDQYHVARHAVQVALQYPAKRWTGAGWVNTQAIRVWNGTAFVDTQDARRWDGSQFV